ncbi:MAG: hypothetical protein PHX62_04715 [Bacilli bacterium]|nr:hypothetical protein [Bacilli bacterium]
MTGWDFNTGGNTKTEFTKFSSGTTTRIRLLDPAPFMRWTHWIPKHQRAINCPGKGCPICEIRKQQKANKEPYTYPVARRFSMNIINRELNRVEILEQGVTFFNDLKDLLEDLIEDGKSDKSINDFDLKVRRRGSSKDDTSYRIDFDSEYPLTKEEQELADNTVLLHEFFKPHTIEQITRIINGEDWNEVMSNNNNDNTEEEISIS